MTDRVAGLFETLASDTPSSIRDRARELASAFVGRTEQLPLAPGDDAGPYEIVGVLGAGGQAVVYEARHKHLGRRVALKVPRKELGDRLTREAKLVADLAHPSIVQVVDLSLDGPVPYLVLELCEKGSLEDRLDVVVGDGLPLEQVHAIATSILEALAFAHRRGVIHRDVKPANVLFDRENRAKVSDFGIGTIARADELSVSVELSQLSLLAGTPLYVAPEQENPALRVGGLLDGRADLFSFGKVLFQMLTGASPRTIRPPSRLRPGLDPAWDDYVFRLTEERPEKRFEDAREALHELPRLATRTPIEPVPSLAEALAPVVTGTGEEVAGCRILDKSVDPDGSLVYRAWHSELGRTVLIRVLSREASANAKRVARFLREAQAVSKLEHPNVVQVLNVGKTDDGSPYVVLENVEGKTLAQVLEEGGRQPWKSAVRIAASIARALATAHSASVLHRDVKPSNVTVDDAGRVKVGGFLKPDPTSDMKLTANGAMIGTPLYMPPELGRVKELDGRADLYSLGLVLYELVTGENPLRKCSAIEILSARAHERIPPIEDPTIPLGLRRVIARLLEKDRDRRYRSAAELLEDLAAVEKGLPVHVAPSPEVRGHEARVPDRLALVVTGLLLLGVFAGLMLLGIHLIRS